MRRILARGLSAATVACALILASPAFAGGSGMPWESPLQKIQQSITGPVVQAAAIIAVVIFGGGVAMSESGGTLRRGLGILFGLSIAFAVACLLVATLARWGLAQVRPDVYFTPYFPAVFFAAAFGGLRLGIVTALVGGVLGVVLNFGAAPPDAARFVLLLIYWLVAALTIWGVGHYRDLVLDFLTRHMRRSRPMAA